MQLLVSVATETEVEAAVKGGADIIDIKNPHEGALGANFPAIISRVRELTPPHLPVSVALGDAPNLPGTISLAARGAATCQVQFIKVGLLGPNTAGQAIFMLQQVKKAAQQVNPDCQIIAAAYADARKVQALPPMDLPAVAAGAGVAGCLLDTAVKHDGSLLTNLSQDQLRRFCAQCHEHNLLCALAGSLRASDLATVCATGPDIIGVRTAACQGDRVHGFINAHKVRSLKDILSECGSR